MEWMKRSMSIIIMGWWMIMCISVGAAAGAGVKAAAAGRRGVKAGYMPAMFVFGDSLADAGNNNYIPHCTARANITPYGVSFFPKPTGRFTNGRTAFDFIATYLGLPFAPPFLKPNATFSRGINFASGASGLLNSTGINAHIMSTSDQVWQFEHFSYNLVKTHPSGAAQAHSYLAKSLYCISAGGNDVGAYITNATVQNTTTPQGFVATLLTKFDQYVARLYRAGARKFLVLNIPPVGCTPNTKLIAYNISKGECFDSANQLAVAYNTALKAFVDHLNQKLDGATAIQLNTYDYFMNILQNGGSYGFSDTKSACCGSGMFNTQVSCGKTKVFCNDTNAYVFWDGTHPTQKVYALFSHQIWAGNSSVIYPFNLSTLVSVN